MFHHSIHISGSRSPSHVTSALLRLCSETEKPTRNYPR